MKLVRAKEGYRKVGDEYLLAKKCTCCGEWKVANTDNFHKNKNSKYGLSSYCKECTSNRRKARYGQKIYICSNTKIQSFSKKIKKNSCKSTKIHN